MEHLMFTLVTFILFTAAVGVISAKIVKGGDDQKTAKGYFLAGSGLGGTFIAGSMLLTNLSAENLVGLSGQSYAANMSGMAWEATAVIATIVMAFVFLPLYLRKGYTTLPEFMEERYGIFVRRMVSLFFLVGYLLIGIPVCLYAGAIGFNQIFDLSHIFGISSQTALTILIVLVGIIGALYAVLGGRQWLYPIPSTASCWWPVPFWLWYSVLSQWGMPRWTEVFLQASVMSWITTMPR